MGHLDPDTLGALVDGSLRGEDARRVRDHLFECRSCMAAYVDAVRYRAAWLAQPESFAADSGLSNAARRAFAGRPAPRPAFAGQPALRLAWVGGLLALAAAAVLVVMRPGYSPSLHVQLPPAVRATTERLSADGLVLPGGVAGANRGPSGLRSGQGVASPELDQELDAALRAYEAAPGTAGRGVRLVGAFIAAGELDAARAYAREVLRQNPREVPALIQAAVIEYRMNELDRALDLLKRAAREAPGDPIVALNTALVLERRSLAAEARPLLQRVGGSRVRELSERAKRELRE